MKTPRFLRDLYGDLRDRRLLPVVGVLLVAIPAVPMLLKTDPPPPVTDSGYVAASDEELQGLPAVLASEEGLRDYRERLDGRGAKSPFAQDEAESAAEPADLAEVAGSEAVAEAAVAQEAAASTEKSASTSSAEPATTTVEKAPAETSSGSGSSGERSGAAPRPVQVAFRVDVEVGRVGDTKRRASVKLLTVLPSKGKPIAMYLGASENGKSATFLVSEEVSETRGDGSCMPSASGCEFVTLKQGEQQRFEYGADSEDFVLKVVDIHLAKIPGRASR